MLYSSTMTGSPRLIALLSASSLSLHAASADALKFFENKVRPILVKQCQECHGAQKKKGGLRLDNLPYILQGGETGPAIVPHKPDESLLIKAVEFGDKDMQMPPDGKMSAAEIGVLKQWISMGAPWPEAEVASAKLARKPGQITDEDRKWWAFRPVVEPKVPMVSATVKQSDGASVGNSSKSKASNKSTDALTNRRTGPLNPIDNFVQARLAESGLKPSPMAERGELIRRLSFDLHGLPPSPRGGEGFRGGQARGCL